MTYKILRQARVFDRPIQNYVMDAGRIVEFRNSTAAQLEAARLRMESSDPFARFTVVGTKH